MSKQVKSSPKPDANPKSPSSKNPQKSPTKPENCSTKSILPKKSNSCSTIALKCKNTVIEEVEGSKKISTTKSTNDLKLTKERDGAKFFDKNNKSSVTAAGVDSRAAEEKGEDGCGREGELVTGKRGIEEMEGEIDERKENDGELDRSHHKIVKNEKGSNDQLSDKDEEEKKSQIDNKEFANIFLKPSMSVELEDQELKQEPGQDNPATSSENKVSL